MHFDTQTDFGIRQPNDNSPKLEEASTHKSAKTHAGNVFVTRNLDL